MRNYGAGSAHDIHFELDGDLKLLWGRLCEHLLFTEGLRCLAQGSSCVNVAASTTVRRDEPPDESGTVRRVRVVATYKSASGRNHRSETYLELLHGQFTIPPLQQMAVALQRIAEAMEARR